MQGNEIDPGRAREETPGCHNRIHFNNAGAALMPAPVLNGMIDHIRLEGEIGGYEAAGQAADMIEATYEGLAELLGADRSQIAITSSATRAWDMAFYGMRFGKGDQILTAMSEYGSNYIALLQVARRTGAVVKVIPGTPDGAVDVDALEGMIGGMTRLIAITHVPSNGGLVNPAAEIGRVARRHGIFYMLDACQSVGQMPVRVDEIGCDILTATGRKYLRGPRGIGFLYAGARACRELEPPFLDLNSASWSARDEYVVREDARRFEEWESNVAAKIGLGIAAKYAQRWGLEAIEFRIRNLASELRGRLAGIPGVRVHDLGEQRCGIVTFTMEGTDPHSLQRMLAARGINISVSGIMAARLDMEMRHLAGLARASLHYYNSSEEIGLFCEALSEIRSAIP